MKIRWRGVNAADARAVTLPREHLADSVTGEIQIEFSPDQEGEVVELTTWVDKAELRCTPDSLLELLKPIVIKLLRHGQTPKCTLMNGGEKPFITWSSSEGPPPPGSMAELDKRGLFM